MTMRGALTPRMQRFVDEVTHVVREGGGEDTITRQVAAKLAFLLKGDDLLDPRFTRPKPDSYVLYPVWIGPGGNLSVAAAVWDVGQVTPIHDHGTWGVIGIYRGVEHEVRYRLAHAPGTGPLQQVAERDIRAGEVIVCCTSDQDIHRVSCGSAIACVGIHVYGADIGVMERHVYDLRSGTMRTFVSGWMRVED